MKGRAKVFLTIVVLAIVGFLIGLMFFSMWLASTAYAHSWYETNCCDKEDCKPVEVGVVDEDHLGVHVKGFGILSPGDSRLRWSRDKDDHLCIAPGGKLRCVYRKPPPS